MSIEDAKKVLEIESEAIKDLIKQLDNNFSQAVKLISKCKGRVIVTGLGKSGLIGRKIASTLSSTGTSAFFVHPVEGMHGDMGMVMKEDVVLTLSYSGETEEMKRILPLVKRLGLKLITLTGNPDSSLAKESDVVLNVKVKKEACPFNLAPTASTTAMLALGDALAIVLLDKKGFREADFALLHPAGVIGKKLLLRVKDVMRKGEENPLIDENKRVKEALLVMTSTRLGAVSVVDKKGKLVGFFTDGDLRRHLQKDKNLLEKKISSVMTKKPTTITKKKLATEAVRILQEKKFDNIPVVDEDNRPIGIVDERDLLKEGIA
ncbi:MAG TPA: KpsF/GutQ family sugar-phosphate isomerase [bacterium]|nr:KpsF/GutQ family sugar-phosphate isomerase [bacterium]